MSHTFPKGLYAIIDDSLHRNYGLTKLLHNIVENSEIPVIQLRMKVMNLKAQMELVRIAFPLKTHRPFTLIVNDESAFLAYPDVDGVHLGQEDETVSDVRERYGRRIIGVSTHTVDEVLTAQKQKADYIGCGCVFPTASKSDTQPLGLDGLQLLVQRAMIPTVAIGGINDSNIASVAQTGCTMAAVISGLIQNDKFVGQKLHETFIKNRLKSL